MTNRWFALQVINLGTLMSTMDVGLVNVALPKIAHQFGIPFNQVQWIVTCYLLSMITCLPFFGRLSDMVSRKTVYCAGFLVFSLGCLLVDVASGLWFVVLARCIQGLGATMIMANSQAMVVEVFPNQERGKALGFNAVVISFGTLIGPVVGGSLMDLIGWAALFLVQVPLGVAGALLGWRWFPKTPQKARQKFDLPGSGMLSCGLCLILWAASNSGGSSDWTQTLVPALVGFAFIAGLIVYEARLHEGILDRDLFMNRRIVVGNSSLAIVNLTQTASLMAITFYMQDVLTYSPREAGLVLGVQPLMMGVVSPFAGWYRDRYGPVVPVTIGPLLCGVSMLPILFSHVVQLGEVMFQLGLFGIGVGMFQATNNADVMSAAPPAKTSMAGSILALLRYLGMSIGMGLTVLLLGNIGVHQIAAEAVQSRMKMLFLVCTFLSLAVGALAIARWPNWRSLSQ